MPRKDEPDTASGGKQSPEPTTSQSPDLVCAGRDNPENRASSVDPSLQERREASAENLDDPKSSASDALSEDSMCSRCGGSKSTSDKNKKTLPPTETLCKCDPDLPQSKLQENPDTEDISESVASDTLSDDSVCSKCGGTKRGRSTDLKPRKFSCKCRPKVEEVDDTEMVPLEAGPFVAVATEETSQIETFRDRNADLRKRELPPESEGSKGGSNEEETRENRNNVESCLPDCSYCDDISCKNCNWPVTLVIVGAITVILIAFIYGLATSATSKQEAPGKDSNSSDFFERDSLNESELF